jgi:anaerobic magnesium-protoporphyrin IX monomethyl ester cyclase
MSIKQRVLLVNPSMTPARNARFPLAILNLASALEGPFSTTLLDGNVDRDFIATTLRAVNAGSVDALGVSVMGGPQLPPAIALSKAVRAAAPQLPIIWGGAFPTNCPDATLNTSYVDYAVRAQGEATFTELLQALQRPALGGLDHIDGLSWCRDGQTVHNRERHFSAVGLMQRVPYERLAHPRRYLTRTYLGRHTAGYQAGLGCRYRCTFCGVATMFRGRLALPTAARLEEDLRFLTTQLGADAIQFYDHNFFDREVDMVPLLQVLARFKLPWWCFARADALLELSESSWKLVRESQLKMAYIGAESPSDWLLHDIRKGTRTDQTLAAVELCHRHGVVPELSFMLAPPQDPEGETERTFEFIRQIKARYPRTEVMLYVYTPLPARPGSRGRRPSSEADLRDCAGHPVVFPTTAEGWAQPQWRAYWCHTDSPWISASLRERIRDFTTVLGCRYPTVTDIRSPRWGKLTLSALASWRYRFRRYGRPWELDLSKKFIRLHDPRVSSL